MRAFVALDLPDSVAIALDRLQEHIPEGRLVPPENLHLTLLFLDGDRPVSPLWRSSRVTCYAAWAA
jgi:2'-5' RNA ligase